LLRKFFRDTLELLFDPLDLLPRTSPLRIIQLHGRRAGQPAMGAVYNRGDHLQIADQFRTRPGRGFLLPLRFEKQRRILQNALANRGRSSPPGRIQLSGFPRVAVLLGENGRHALAVFQALAGYWHQKLHGCRRRDLALPHLLLNGFR